MSTAVYLALLSGSMIVLALVVRRLLPPASRPPASEGNDEMSRRLGLPREAHRTRSDASSPPVNLSPRTARDPIFDEDERLYGDPVIAARLKHVLRSARLDLRRSQAKGGPVAGHSVVQRASSPLGPRLVQDNDGQALGHTGGEPPPASGWTIDLDPEFDPMPAPDPQTTAGDRPEESGALLDSYRGDQPTVDRVGRPPDKIGADVPSNVNTERLASGGPAPSNVLPFVPRTAPGEATAEATVDAAVVGAITATVRELLFCANVGELLHGFALYSDRYLFRFMDETGLSAEAFREAFGGVPAKEADAWTRLSRLDEVRRLDDGRVTAVVAYLEGDRPSISERYTFTFGTEQGMWLIDDIAPV